MHIFKEKYTYWYKIYLKGLSAIIYQFRDRKAGRGKDNMQ